jgi:hypothetical protein
MAQPVPTLLKVLLKVIIRQRPFGPVGKKRIYDDDAILDGDFPQDLFVINVSHSI